MVNAQVRRNSQLHTLTGSARSSIFAQWAPYTLNFTDAFEDATISHGRNASRGNSKWDSGGPWLMNKSWYELHPIGIFDPTGNGPYLSSDVTGWTHTPMADYTESELIALGTRSIANAAPTNPAFSLPRAIGELKKDGLPSIGGTQLWREKANFLKGSGSEYLNIEFAWKPLISDVRKFANAVTTSDKIIAQYRKASHTKVRRRIAYPPEHSEKSIKGNCFLTPAPNTRIAEGYTSTVEERKTWFSGAFKYYIPVSQMADSKLASHVLEAKKLLGVRLTPDVLWELAPWSWAADWFANTGDIMTNVSNLGTDGLVMQYGYMMASRNYEKTTHFSYQGKSGFKRFTAVSKRRVAASPYGFTTTFDGLSNRQKAISAAIGITRVR